MEFVQTAGGSSLRISRLALGTMTFGSQVEESEAAHMIQLARDADVNLFDTANNYNEGRSEEYLGRAVRPFRDEVLIATKVRNRVGPGPLDEGLSPPAIRKALDNSLRRLQTSYLDIYYLHRPDPDVPVEDTLGAMSELVAAGKVRCVGISNYAAWQICQMSCMTRGEEGSRVEVSQVLYNLIGRRIEEEYEPFASASQLLTFVFNPLAGGLLTGKYRDPDVQAWTDGGVFDQREVYRQRYWGRQQFDAVQRFDQIADQAGLALIELAYRWLLSRPVVGGVIIGASSMQQLKANLAAADGPTLDDETLAACDDVWFGVLRGSAPPYNR